MNRFSRDMNEVAGTVHANERSSPLEAVAFIYIFSSATSKLLSSYDLKYNRSLFCRGAGVDPDLSQIARPAVFQSGAIEHLFLDAIPRYGAQDSYGST
jgi:hypothetical protein